MIRALCLTSLLCMLSACDTGPTLGVGLGFGPGGVSVSPTVSGKVGRVNVGASL